MCRSLFGDPMDCSPPGSSVHGISQTRILKWVAISYSSIYMYPSLLDFLPIQVTTEHWVEFPVLKSVFSLVSYFIYTINSVCMPVTLYPESQRGSICHFGIKFYLFFYFNGFYLLLKLQDSPQMFADSHLIRWDSQLVDLLLAQEGVGAGKPSCSLHCARWS